MPASTLDPDNLPSGRRREGPTGHDTRTLGPSDSSDSGSDMAGPGLIGDDELHLDRGTNEDSERGSAASADAGASVGDIDMDSDTDRFGTGEATSAGREPRVRGNADIGTDRVVGAEEAGLGQGLDQAEEAQLGITDEEIERELGIEDEPFAAADEAELLRAPAKKPASTKKR